MYIYDVVRTERKYKNGYADTILLPLLPNEVTPDGIEWLHGKCTILDPGISRCDSVMPKFVSNLHKDGIDKHNIQL